MRLPTIVRAFNAFQPPRIKIDSNDAVTETTDDADQKPCIDYICDTCSRPFTKKSHLDRHIRKHTGEKPFKCNQCHRGFSRSDKLLMHLREHSGDKRFTCRVCSKSFTTNWERTQHFHTHTNYKPFECSTCSTSFNRKSNLRRHMLVHDDVKKCSTSKSYTRKRTCSGVDTKPFICSACLMAFGTIEDLEVHELAQHATKTNAFKPTASLSITVEKSLEDKKCSSPSLNGHGVPQNPTVRSCVQTYTCGNCHRSYLDRKKLNRHLKSGRFSCVICSAVICGKRYFRTHLNIHNYETKKWKHKCEVCCKTFSQRTQLTIHLRKHTGERLFTCPTCSNSFYSKRDLNRHFRTHSDIKPFNCAVCSISFSQKCNWDRHTKTNKHRKAATSTSATAMASAASAMSEV